MAKLNLVKATENDSETWETCIVCGSAEVTDTGLTVDNAISEVERVAWCGERECQDDLLQSLGAVVLVDHVGGEVYRLAPPPA